MPPQRRCVTDRAGVQPRPQPTPDYYSNLPTPKGWKAELAYLADPQRIAATCKL